MKATINNSLLATLKAKEKYYDVWDKRLGGFHIRVSPSGKKVFRCLYGRNKIATIGNSEIVSASQARIDAKHILGEAGIGIYPQRKTKTPKTPPTLLEFIQNQYQDWKMVNGKDASGDLKRLERNFLSEFGDLLLTDITPLLLDQWCAKRIREGKKPKTVNRDVSVLKTALNMAAKWQVIKSHDLLTSKPLTVEDDERIRYLTKDEAEHLKTALKNRDQRIKQERVKANQWRSERGYPCLVDLNQFQYADHLTPMVLISLNTGLRKGALCKLRWEHVDFDNAVLTAVASTAKSSKTSRLPLNSVALGVLKNWKQQCLSPIYVFANPTTGKPFGDLKRSWTNLLKQAQIENFRWHDMRHHFASKLVMAGVDLNTVRELLVHSDITMTLRYAHLAPEHKAEAVSRIVDSM